MKATLGKNPIAAVTGRVDSLTSKTDFFFFSFFLLLFLCFLFFFFFLTVFSVVGQKWSFAHLPS